MSQDAVQPVTGGAGEAPPQGASKPAEGAAPAEAAPAVHLLKGDLGQSLKHAGALRIAGSVCAGVTLEVEGTLNVDGTVESATVTATGNLTAAGGIVGRGKGRYVTRESLSARSVIAATIEARDNVSVSVEIANSQIVAGGVLNCEQGHLYGGHATVNGGVQCGTLGSPGGSETVIEAGIDEELRRLSEKHSPEIEANQKRIAKVRMQVEPLMAQQKALTPKQKESATELLYQAGELEERTMGLIADLRAKVGASYAKSKAEVLVTTMIYPGVTIRFPGFEVTIERAVKGPVRIYKGGKGAGAKIMMIDLKDNAELFVKYNPHTDPHLAALGRVLVVPKDKKKAA